MEFPYKKILILGCGGAGKSTFAIDMGNWFSLPVVHLDKLYWLPGWINRSNEDFDKLLEKEIKKEMWIIDGNYKRTLQWRLEYADVAILFDLPDELCFEGVKQRIQKYNGKSRPDITEGCPESFDPEFNDWITNFRKDILPDVIKILKESGKQFFIFTSRESAWDWLKSFKKTT